MSDPHPLQKRYPLFESIARTAHVDATRFEKMRRKADEDPEGFWGEVGKRIDWITGRVDDVINVSGHRLGTAEVESALVAHAAVAEAAVVGFPHDIKGQGVYAYVTLMGGREGDDDLAKELIKWVRTEIGPIATIDRHHRSPAVVAGPAQDALGQDHAPHPAQDRGRRARPAG